MINSDTFIFLDELKKSNNREWFNANKTRYTLIREDFISFLESILPYLAEIDPEIKGVDARKSVFRINRDIRFSNDKSPYKTTLAGVLIAGGRKNFSEHAGYYIHLESGKSIIAGGAYLPPANWINSIRKEISANSDEFRSLISTPRFKKYGTKMEGEQLKGAPRGYSKDNPDIDLLRYKSFLAVNSVTDKFVTGADFSEHFINVAKELKPFNDFLNYKSV